jgi:CRISPR-associated protein Cmr2
LAIAHIVEPLGQTRDLAQRAEKAAKGDGYLEHERRNALGIALDVRGGNETLLRLRWDDQAGRQAFRDMVKAYMDKTLPSRVAYDVRSLHQQTVFALAEKDGIGAKIQQAELKRMFDKARTREGKMISTEHVQALTHRAKRGLNRLADELIVARWLSAKVQSDLGEDGAV